MTYLDIARAQLKVDEGVRQLPYVDTVGKMTVGVGRNLTDKGLSPDEIDLLLDNDIKQAEKDAILLVGEGIFSTLSDNRKAVMVNLAFNLGFRKLSQFVETLRHVKSGAFDYAADSMADSLWYRQVGPRGERLVKQMRDG